MMSPAPEMMKSTLCPRNFPSIYGSTAINARNDHPKRFRWFETLCKYSAVSVPGLIPGMYPPLFWMFSATCSVLKVIDT